VAPLKGNIAVISQPYGGLGDNLQFSNLPEMFARRGIETWISSQNVCRNSQIYEMAWGMNPHVKGVTDEPPNVRVQDVEVSPGIGLFNTVQRAEMLYFGEWENRYPKIFYQPKPRPEFVGKAVLEFGYVTVDLTSVRDRVRDCLPGLLKGREAVLLRNPVNKALDVGNYPPYEVKDIWELADILWSCQMFIGIESGAAVLCATVKQDKPCDGIYVFCRHLYVTAKAFQYENETPIEVL